MPRSTDAASTADASTPAPAGHNKAPLTDDEASALTTYYALKIIEDQRKAEAKKVELDGAKAVVNGHFKLISKDLGFTRKEFEAEVIEKLNMTDAEYLSSERRRDRLHRLAGLKPGDQLDLLDTLADTVDDAIAAEANGYRAGRRADDPVPPKDISPILHQDWLRGWHEGQAFNGRQLELAMAVLARPKPGEMAPAPSEDAEEDPADPEVIKRQANALKDGGWVEPRPDETAFEESDNGRALRKPKSNGRAHAEEPAVA
jgi:hypothetical protein